MVQVQAKTLESQALNGQLEDVRMQCSLLRSRMELFTLDDVGMTGAAGKPFYTHAHSSSASIAAT